MLRFRWGLPTYFAAIASDVSPIRRATHRSISIRPTSDPFTLPMSSTAPRSRLAFIVSGPLRRENSRDEMLSPLSPSPHPCIMAAWNDGCKRCNCRHSACTTRRGLTKHYNRRRSGGIGRRAGFKIPSWQQGEGSSPSSGNQIAFDVSCLCPGFNPVPEVNRTVLRCPAAGET